MESSSYDIDVQLALALTAESEGNFEAARMFLAEAARVAGEHRRATGRDLFAAPRRFATR